MDIQEINLRRSDFEAMHPTAKLFNFDAEKMVYFGDGPESINSQWSTWCACIGMFHLEIKEAKAVPEWISTEDKEPVENGNYLVCIGGDVFYLTAKWVKNHFKFLARGYGLTEDFTDWRYCEGVKVTHWMLLPDSPKAQEPTND